MSTEAEFLVAVRQMFDREDFLFPCVWAQRQYRDDNYQMGSQSLLEDLFYDALGAFLLQTSPGVKWLRRTGREPWDYSLNGLQLSHKEAVTPMFTSVWQPGGGPTHKEPKFKTWTYDHPIVFFYTPLKAKFALERSTGDLLEAFPVTHKLLDSKSFDAGQVALVDKADGEISVLEVWPAEDWRSLTIFDLRQAAGPANLRSRDLLHFPAKAHSKVAWSPVLRGEKFKSVGGDPGAGVYLFSNDDLVDVPMESNNKAHFAGKETVRALLASAIDAGRCVGIPLWPAIFADVTPPDLYRIQRGQYEDLFHARAQ